MDVSLWQDRKHSRGDLAPRTPIDYLDIIRIGKCKYHGYIYFLGNQDRAPDLTTKLAPL